MTAIELKMSLLQEVMSLEDEQLIKKALDSVRRMKMAAFGKATPVEKPADDYAEPTKEEILAGLRNALQDVKDLRELSALGKSLSENPDQGTSLGKGVRKVRMAIVSKGKGKSHGARVITYTEAIVCADNEGTVILLTIYDKADRDSISAAEIDELLRSLRWEL